MNCGGARRLFGAYWDDEITLAERDWLESHFNSCAACRGEYEQFARSIELVGSLPRVEVQRDVAERALARARRSTAVADRLPLGTPRWMPITATAALLTIAATMALQWMGVTPPGRIREPAPVAQVSQPELLEPARAEEPSTAAATNPAADVAAAPGGVTDSLFDHSADVEFILDPVVLKKGRAHTVLKLDPSIRGEKAVITF
ncbi:MAG: anti-sigma factor family protein [Candidatus Eiseniibacteriota bacterium]